MRRGRGRDAPGATALMNIFSIFRLNSLLGLMVQAAACLLMYLAITQAIAKGRRHYVRWLMPTLVGNVLQLTLSGFFLAANLYGIRFGPRVYVLSVIFTVFVSYLYIFGLVVLWRQLKDAALIEPPSPSEGVWPPAPRESGATEGTTPGSQEDTAGRRVPRRDR